MADGRDPQKSDSSGRSGARPEAGGEVSTMSGVLSGLDPKPGELPMARLKFR